ncbi:MAG: DUF1059 domain-containing protein [Actinomycetota bacterium]|nr:DUF1059 domain-containing protein [Actinomycetota bacterium]MDP1876334.1 DUF1059 domain-containing protein [Actinomycetota bacterium]
MAYSLTCADTGADCPGAFTASTTEELGAHLQVHAQHAHPDMANSPEAAAMVQGLIKTV